MRRVLLGLVLVGGTALGVGAWLLRTRMPALESLPPRAAPNPSCHFKILVDRESISGEPVRFGVEQCPAESAALQIGRRWFQLPSTVIASNFSIVRRTENNRHWIVVGETREDTAIFRSDDGGASFVQLASPSGSRATIVAEGGELEKLTLTTTVERGVPARVLATAGLLYEQGRGARASHVTFFDLLGTCWRWSGEADSKIFVSRDAGRTWSAEDPFPPSPLHGRSVWDDRY